MSLGADRPSARSRLEVLPDPEALARAGADLVVATLGAAVTRAGRATVALSGGSTPRVLHRLLAEDPRLAAVWSRLHVFWGDERHVAPDHPDSNYRMARETLLDRVPVPAANVHRVPTEEPEAATAAARYETDLRETFAGLDRLEDDWPRFDLVLLGMGADGHTASLFPGTEAVREATRWVAAPWVDKLGAFRVTLTPPVLNRAAVVVLLVAGADKAETVREVRQGPSRPDRYPVQVIAPVDGQLVWLLDRAAAARLDQSR